MPRKVIYLIFFMLMNYVCLSIPSSWNFQNATSSSALIGLESGGNFVVSGRQIGIGDAVGAFYTNSGDTICAGYFVWNGVQFGFAVSGDDATTATKDGFAQGEKYIFKIWDNVLNYERVAHPSFSSGADEYSQNAVSVLSSLVCGEQATLQLRAGWNMVSSPLIPYDSTFVNCTASIGQNLLYARNQSGIIYSRNQLNEISIWHRGDAFYMYLSEADTLFIYGSKIQQMSSNLSTGWNLLPYCKSESVLPENLFAGVIDKIVIITDDSGGIYMPAYGINTIGSMAPGKAYRVFAKQSCSIVY